MDSVSPELSLDIGPSFVPKTITDFLREVSVIDDVSEKIGRLEAFVKELEEEMKKIDAFKRELPLCMLLLNDATKVLKDEVVHSSGRESRPVLEEFIPLKKQKACETDEERGEELMMTTGRDNDSRDKKNWMSSVQLWNVDEISSAHNKRFFDRDYPQPERNHNERFCAGDDSLFRNSEKKTDPRGFLPYKRYSIFPVDSKEESNDGPVEGLSLLTPGNRKPIEDCGSGLGSVSSSRTSGGRANSSSALGSPSNLRSGPQPPQTSRKQRRCWSPDLHRRFVSALQQLGGSHAATPKQIRELMQVEGLTNDEVKSHLQKYRLHTRRLQGPSNQGPSSQTMVVLGGIWGSQEHCSETSKGNSSLSGSPQGPLQLAAGTSMTCVESLEDEEDAKSESYSWKGHAHKLEKDDA